MARSSGSHLHRRRRGDRRSSPHPAGGDTAQGRTVNPADVAAAAQLACLLEVVAPKPGNVTVGASFHDTRVEDFLASAAAIGPIFASAGVQPLGWTIRAAVEATRRWTAVNTNLGIVLLLAPLARASCDIRPGTLRQRLGATLARTTVEDARDAYAAIRLAGPAGMGRVAEQDIAAAPTIPLRDAMVLAADHDAIAREYASEFQTTFDVGVPALSRALDDGLSWSEATVETYLTLLAAAPDTHIARKLGAQEAAAVRRGALEVLAAGGVRRPAGREAIAALDRDLRDPRNAWNPGATADLTAAAIFVALMEGAWPDRREEIRGSAR